MVCRNYFVVINDGGKTLGEECDPFKGVGGNGGAGEAGDVFETGFRQVVDYEKGRRPVPIGLLMGKGGRAC